MSTQGLVRRVAALMAIVALGGTLTACGSDDDSDDTSEDTTTTEAGATSEFEKASGAVRGFDGTTVTVASLGIKGQLPGVEFGAQARIKRFNDTNELDGVKIDYAEFADDKLDPATALSEARRLVTDTKIFGIVGDVSAVNPGDYLAQQHVPYIGWAFDFSYCSAEPSTELWGFGINGCLVPEKPAVMPDQGGQLYDYVKEKIGKEHPTVAMFSNDNTSGRNSVRLQKVAYEGAGFDVVYAKGNVPLPPVTDYAPYVQEYLKADGGKAPDVMVCLLAIDCIPIWQLVSANNYAGTYAHSLYSDALLDAMKGTVASIAFVAFNESTPALETMKKDVAAVKADQAIDTGVSTGYFSADMFIQALKRIARDGKDYITPENLQKALAKQSWEIEGLTGPTNYPQSTVGSSPRCASIVENADGTAWKTIVPYGCSDRTFPVE